MSLIACPWIEFLDEPTTGVDPVSRRSLFKMLKGLNDSSMVLTTHRMDEAESLCDNIAIMINGRFVCYGSPGHLKSAYGQGYSISLSHTMPIANVHQNVIQLMPFFKQEQTGETDQIDRDTGAKIHETFYKIEQTDNMVQQYGGLSSVFRQLIQLRNQGVVKDFTVTRSSLEQVFVQFAKYQVEQPAELAGQAAVLAAI